MISSLILGHSHSNLSFDSLFGSSAIMAEEEGEKEVTLLGTWSSPFVLRVKWALRIKGVEYTYVEEDLRNKSPQLLQYNPVHKKVPVLVHRGRAIAESSVILHYIDEAWPHHPLLPHHPYEKAMARFWCKFEDDKVQIHQYSYVLFLPILAL